MTYAAYTSGPYLSGPIKYAGMELPAYFLGAAKTGRYGLALTAPVRAFLSTTITTTEKLWVAGYGLGAVGGGSYAAYSIWGD